MKSLVKEVRMAIACFLLSALDRKSDTPSIFSLASNNTHRDDLRTSHVGETQSAGKQALSPGPPCYSVCLCDGASCVESLALEGGAESAATAASSSPHQTYSSACLLS